MDARERELGEPVEVATAFIPGPMVPPRTDSAALSSRRMRGSSTSDRASGARPVRVLALLALTTGHTLLETARDALFLAKLPAARLPWMYLVIVAPALALARVPRARRTARAVRGDAWLVARPRITPGFWALSRLEGALGALRALRLDRDSSRRG